MKKNASWIVLAAAAALLRCGGSSGSGPAPGENTNGYYADSPWVTLHRDSRNSDSLPFAAPVENRVDWTALDGAAAIVPFSIGPEGNRYISTGQGPGHSHLHAFDRHGNLLWESAPQAERQYDETGKALPSFEALDSGAIGEAPVIDKDGDIYVCDSNQLWAFRPDGRVKWASTLPDGSGPLVTAILTKEGYVGGITSYDGKLVLFTRDEGKLAIPIFPLPVGKGPPPPPCPEGGCYPPGLWANGLADDLAKNAFWATLGYGVSIANTPAVDPASGRMFVNGAFRTESGEPSSDGVLIGIDIRDGQAELAFEPKKMAGGSGSSPDISPDGRHLYVADGNGVMDAFDTATGDLVWQVPGAGFASSPTVDEDGIVYSGGPYAGDSLIAMYPDKPDSAPDNVKWRASFDWIAEAMLPEVAPFDNPLYTNERVATMNSVIASSSEHLSVVLVLGYKMTPPPPSHPLAIPNKIVLVSVNKADGSVAGSPTELRDSSDATMSIGTDGGIQICHGAFITSIFYYGLNPILPLSLKVTRPPVGGVTVLRPLSYRDQAVAGADWAGKLDTSALGYLDGSNPEAASTAIRRAIAQIEASIGTVLDAESEEEIAGETSIEARERLAAAAGALSSALAGASGPPGVEEARALVTQASAELENAVAALLSAAEGLSGP